MKREKTNVIRHLTNYWQILSAEMVNHFISHQLIISLLEDFLGHLHYTNSLLFIQSFD